MYWHLLPPSRLLVVLGLKEEENSSKFFQTHQEHDQPAVCSSDMKQNVITLQSAYCVCCIFGQTTWQNKSSSMKGSVGKANSPPSRRFTAITRHTESVWDWPSRAATWKQNLHLLLASTHKQDEANWAQSYSFCLIYSLKSLSTRSSDRPAAKLPMREAQSWSKRRFTRGMASPLWTPVGFGWPFLSLVELVRAGGSADTQGWNKQLNPWWLSVFQVHKIYFVEMSQASHKKLHQGF